MDASYVALLQKIPLFAGLDAPSLQALAAQCRRRRFRAGEALFHEGDAGHTLYLIVSGRINIQTVLPSGEIVHLAQRGPGEHFGELSLIDGKPRMADAMTAEASDLLMLDRSAFIRCVEQSPQIALSIMAELADRLRQAGDQLESHKGLDVLGRLSEAILELAKSHGTAAPSGGTRIGVRVTQQEIADQIGATRESVNRALTSLKRVGAIRFEGRTMIVTSLNKLRQYCAK